MSNRRKWMLAKALCIASLGFSVAANAQWAVIDVGAIAQLVQQVATMQQQLETAKSHLTEAQNEFASITGTRGMESLLSGTARNYLPADWAALTATVSQANSTYALLSADIQRV